MHRILHQMKIITFKNLDVIQSDSNHANMGIPGKQEDSHEFLFQYLNRNFCQLQQVTMMPFIRQHQHLNSNSYKLVSLASKVSWMRFEPTPKLHKSIYRSQWTSCVIYRWKSLVSISRRFITRKHCRHLFDFTFIIQTFTSASIF